MSHSANQRPIDFRIFNDLGMPEIQVRAGDTILAEGGAGAIMFVLKNGTANVLVNGILVEQISEGGIFGEMALLDNSPRSADIVAITDVSVIPVDEKKFIALITKVPHFGLLVMRALARRIRKMNAMLGAR